jgi:hypothetical protein
MMAKPRDDDLNIREEMRIALFWRGLIGDATYGRFDPEDCLRWYQALELRGRDEIRTLRNQRYFTAQTGVMQGIVGKAPHPPVWLVNAWLERQEHQVPYIGSYWGMAFFVVVCIGLVFGNMPGCANLSPMNTLAMKPPDQPTVTSYPAPPVSGLGVVLSPVAALGPPTAAGAGMPTSNGPQSNGVAGAVSGAVPASNGSAPARGAAGATGPQNIGASAGTAPGAASPP